ncbi:TnsA endonuclease N-terminal domain-containing protein [uncultured Roseobacter sp.]|uniref:TnsA endonuclease N-terminal domain-containing protein n=1 Tax=uncultured Roseobacter sp. TaxID=114847 RepID=UPI00262181BB|nr:TnsA endonuclease N-terminal domain-containing protein [uncultured Roseobacter sp.]
MHEEKDKGAGLIAPAKSRSTREIAKRSRASSRGGVVVDLPADDRSRIMYFESKLEQRVLFLLLAKRSIWDVREQPEAFIYHDTRGRRRHHFFDFLVTLRSGRRLAVAVKPAKRVIKTRFAQELSAIRAAMTKDFADDVILITDRGFCRAEAMNAERYIAFRKHRNEHLMRHLLAVILTLRFPQKVQDVQMALGAGSEGFRAIFIAIYEGLLTADVTQEIDHDTLVRRGGGL